MMKGIYVVILTAFFLVSCGSDQRVFVLGDKVVSHQPDIEMTLTPSTSFSGSFLDGVYGIYCVSDSVFVLNIEDEDHCFRALNLHNNTFVDFLNKGRGPEEVITGYFSGVRTGTDTILLDIVGINEHILYSVDFNETIKEGRTVIRDKIELLSEAMSSFVIGKEVLSEVVYDDDLFSLKLYDGEDQTVSRVVLPYGTEEYLAVCQPLLGSVKRVKPDGTRFCLAMMDFNEVNIVDIKGDKHLSVSVSKHTKDQKIVSDFLKNGYVSHEYYWGGTVTDDAIYALYFDCDISKLEEVRPVIHVFSWDGQLKAIYHLNEYLRSIAISKNGNVLYGLTWDEVIYQYDL